MRPILLLLLSAMIGNQLFAQAPVNDECATAIPLAVNGGYITASNIGTLLDAPNPACGGADPIKDVWFSFQYTGGSISINTALSGTLTDTRIALYNGCAAGPAIACNDDYTGMGYASQLNLTCTQLTMGATYYIQAGGYNSLVGTFGIQIVSSAVSGCTNDNATNYNACATIDDGSCIIANQNDACSSAVPLIPNSGAQNTTNVNSSVGATPGCGGGIHDIWFSFVYQGGNLTLTTAASSETAGTQLVDTQMAVYESCGGSIIACDDDDAAGNYSMIKFGCPMGNGTGGAFEDDV